MNIIKYIEEKEKINIEKDKELLNNEDYIDEIAIHYKVVNIEYSKYIRIFGNEFIENNKELCKIIINGNHYELCAK